MSAAGTPGTAEPKPKIGDHIAFRVSRSWLRDRKTREEQGGDTFALFFMHLVREDLLPHLGTDQISFGPCYMTDDVYHAVARFHLAGEDGKDPATVLQRFRKGVARAKAAGVQGSYEALNVTIGDTTYAAAGFESPGGRVEEGDPLPDLSPEDLAGFVNWMDEHDKPTAHANDRFIEETLRQFDANTEEGKCLRYGIVLGLQAVKDSLSGKPGAADLDRLRTQALMDLGVDLQSEAVSLMR